MVEINNKLLKNDELTLYSYVKCRNLILEIFKLFRYLKRSNKEIAIPKITADYRVRYEQFVPVKNSNVENCAFQNLLSDSKNDFKRCKLLSKITIALRKLNNLELQVFQLTFYEDKNEMEISKKIMYGLDKVREIRKSACIKFVSALGLDYMCFK